MLKQSVSGLLVRVTESHYVTMIGDNVCHWHKDYYRLENQSTDVLNFDDLALDEMTERNVQAIKHNSTTKHSFFERIGVFFRGLVNSQ